MYSVKTDSDMFTRCTKVQRAKMLCQSQGQCHRVAVLVATAQHSALPGGYHASSMADSSPCCPSVVREQLAEGLLPSRVVCQCDGRQLDLLARRRAKLRTVQGIMLCVAVKYFVVRHGQKTCPAEFDSEEADSFGCMLLQLPGACTLGATYSQAYLHFRVTPEAKSQTISTDSFILPASVL